MDKFKDFQKSELVITDRLHGMIFCYITKTPCIVMPNNNHKILMTYEKNSKSQDKKWLIYAFLTALFTSIATIVATNAPTANQIVVSPTVTISISMSMIIATSQTIASSIIHPPFFLQEIEFL